MHTYKHNYFLLTAAVDDVWSTNTRIVQEEARINFFQFFFCKQKFTRFHHRHSKFRKEFFFLLNLRRRLQYRNEVFPVTSDRSEHTDLNEINDKLGRKEKREKNQNMAVDEVRKTNRRLNIYSYS